MSDSEDYGSAKDDNFKASDASAAESSEDEPLVKNKKSAKTPKSKLKKKDKKKSKGRPSKAETKSKGRGRPSKAAKSADTNNDKPEEEYEVSFCWRHCLLMFVLLLDSFCTNRNHHHHNLSRYWQSMNFSRWKRSWATANTTESSCTRSDGRTTNRFMTLGKITARFRVQICSRCTTSKWDFLFNLQSQLS